jgi:hypothetical protein
MEFLGYKLLVPTIIFCDNKSAIELTRTLKQTHKSKHINMRINFIRECINAQLIEILFVVTDENTADALTKPLPIDSYKRHVDHIMNGYNGSIDYIINGSINMLQIDNYVCDKEKELSS